METILKRWFTPAMAQNAPEVIEMIASDFRACDSEGYAACCEAIAAMDQRPTLEQIEAPTLVIGGAADPVCPPAVELELAGSIPGAALCMLPGASHLANLESPVAFNAALSRHLRRDAFERGAFESGARSSGRTT